MESKDKTLLLQIMIFYSLLSYFVAPTIGYYYTKTKDGITYGLVIGSVLSIYLWYSYGQKLINI